VQQNDLGTYSLPEDIAQRQLENFFAPLETKLSAFFSLVRHFQRFNLTPGTVFNTVDSGNFRD